MPFASCLAASLGSFGLGHAEGCRELRTLKERSISSEALSELGSDEGGFAFASNQKARSPIEGPSTSEKEHVLWARSPAGSKSPTVRVCLWETASIAKPSVRMEGACCF